MFSRFEFCLLMVLAWGSVSIAQEHRVEVLKEAPTGAKLAKAMESQFSPQGLKVVRGASRTVCEFWPCEKWETTADFKASANRLYPFQAGQLIGLFHFPRRGKDFRDQTIQSGWYTLRFGLQPNDGNHVGTSPTRDFLLMVRAEDDKTPEPIDIKTLLKVSAEAAGSSHPAMLCLQRPGEDAAPEASMRHNEETDWWVLHFTGKAMAGEKLSELPVDLIVSGHADE